MRGYQKDDVIEVALMLANDGWVYGEKRFILCERAASALALHSWSGWQSESKTKVLGMPFRRERKVCSGCGVKEYRAQSPQTGRLERLLTDA